MEACLAWLQMGKTGRINLMTASLSSSLSLSSVCEMVATTWLWCISLFQGINNALCLLANKTKSPLYLTPPLFPHHHHHPRCDDRPPPQTLQNILTVVYQKDIYATFNLIHTDRKERCQYRGRVGPLEEPVVGLPQNGDQNLIRIVHLVGLD